VSKSHTNVAPRPTTPAKAKKEHKTARKNTDIPETHRLGFSGTNSLRVKLRI
jgi:hypothetical protein